MLKDRKTHRELNTALKLALSVSLTFLVLILYIIPTHSSILGNESGIEKVTDPDKIVKDEQVLNALAAQGIDKDYIELSKDFALRSTGKGYSPYSQTYRDLKSNKEIMLISGLPMVNADGIKIDVGFDFTGGKYYSKANIFSAVVEGTRVTVIALSGQPNGTKQGDNVTWNPQLFLNDKEQLPETSILLEIDPINPYYNFNTVEWDYGICKRRIRIIEGRIRERWVFDINPKGTIRIKHNLTGNLPLKLGIVTDEGIVPLKATVIDDQEIVNQEIFNKAVYPLCIGASPETFYPDADPESTSVDGIVYRGDVDEAWNDIHDGAGSAAQDSNDALYVNISSSTTNNQWKYLFRSIVLFDTSALPNTAIVTAVTLTTFGKEKTDPLGILLDVNVYGSTPASNTGLVGADYVEIGTIPYCDTPITYNGFNIGTPGSANNWNFNASGITSINVTGVSKIGFRNANFDVADNPPAWTSNVGTTVNSWSADKGGDHRPKLVVTYIFPGPNVDIVSITNITPTSSIFTGNITVINDTNITSRGFEWGITPGIFTDNFTDTGIYELGLYDSGNSVTGLVPDTLYFVRAWAINSANNSGVSDPLGFRTAHAEGIVHIQPRLDENSIGGVAKPTDVHVGVNPGFSLPIWSTPVNQNEQLHYEAMLSPLWDNESDFDIHFALCLDTANDLKNFQMQIEWSSWKPGTDVVPITATTQAVEIPTGTALQYQSYEARFSINHTGITSGDMIGFRVRRIDALSDEIAGEVILFHAGMHFIRGDLDEFLVADNISDFITADNISNLISEEDMEALAGTIIEVSGTQVLIVIVFGILVLAFWKRDIILCIISGIITVLVALELVDSYAGIAITLLGLGIYQLITGITTALESAGPSKGWSQFKGMFNRAKG